MGFGLFVATIFVIEFSIKPILVFAHPGGTDSLGCHTCRTNCSDWGLSYGEYHCHNSTGYSQPEYPIHSIYGSGGTGYTVPAPDYAYPSFPTAPSCPSMSSYDSLSRSCKCYSGYVVGTDYLGKEACVSADSKCADALGYGARYNSLSEKCECRYGYLFNGNKCVSEITYCNDVLGLMSRYNSLSEKCECMSGYEFNGSNCAYKKTSYSYPSTYSSVVSDSCPANSHESLTDPTKCQCDAGFQISQARDACVIIPPQYCPPNSVLVGQSCICNGGLVYRDNRCVSNTEDCSISFGSNVVGTPGSSNNSNCECAVGYEWNGNKTACNKTRSQKPIEKVTSPIPTSEDFKVSQAGIDSMEARGTVLSSAAFRRCPSTKCSVVRYFAETSELKILGKYKNDDWYEVKGKINTNGVDSEVVGWIHGSLLRITPEDVGRNSLTSSSSMPIINNSSDVNVSNLTGDGWFKRLWKLIWRL